MRLEPSEPLPVIDVTRARTPHTSIREKGSDPSKSESKGRSATRSWPVGRYTATLSIRRPVDGPIVHADIVWKPGVPHDLTDRDYLKYRTGLVRAIAELGEQLGIDLAGVGG